MLFMYYMLYTSIYTKDLDLIKIDIFFILKNYVIFIRII